MERSLSRWLDGHGDWGCESNRYFQISSFTEVFLNFDFINFEL